MKAVEIRIEVTAGDGERFLYTLTPRTDPLHESMELVVEGHYVHPEPVEIFPSALLQPGSCASHFTMVLDQVGHYEYRRLLPGQHIELIDDNDKESSA